MKIVQALPPMFDEIDATFRVRGKPVFFAWGDTIFNPSGTDISDALLAHEAVHCRRQGDDVEGWWRRYIAEPAFRLAEEIPAHRAEYAWWSSRPDADRPLDGFRSRRLFHLHHIAKRLSGPLYGSLISMGAAKKALEGVDDRKS